MNDDDDRIAYLAGDDRPIPPEDRVELDELRAMLADPSLWAEPPADMEDRVVAAIAAEKAAPSRPVVARRRPWVWRVVGVAAALLIAVGIGVVVTRRDAGGEHFTLALAAPEGAKYGRWPRRFLAHRFRMAGQARHVGAAAPRRQPFLRGVVAQRRRHARAYRNLQRSDVRGAVGGRVTARLSDVDGDAGGSRRQPGVLG